MLLPKHIEKKIGRGKGVDMKKRQLGFTLIELLVVIGILAVLMAIVLVAINPARQFRQSNHTRRTADINAILNAITQYGADHKGDYTAITHVDGTDFPLSGAAASGQTLCAAIVPTYIASLPTDPTSATVPAAGMPATAAGCSSDTTWVTGYTVRIDANDRITVGATSQDIETAAALPISVTR